MQALVAAHTAAIAFENLDVLLKRPIRLDPASLYAKLVHARRGGYCFEHNLLLLDVLTRFGFRAMGLAARVQWGRPPGSVGPRTHMLLRVDLAEGPYIADVGFGGLTPTAPLALAAGPEQATPHETFRLVAADGEFDLEARLGGNWASLYRFSLQPQMPVDYEVANWFTSTHPQSLFVNHLIASRAAPGRRHALFNNRYTVRGHDGGSERKLLPNAATLRSVLDCDFGIALPEQEVTAIAAIAEANAAHPSRFDGGQ
ncbi:MAG: arylamine N-acetyltransferase family protein [Stellaceae bacterium]